MLYQLSYVGGGWVSVASARRRYLLGAGVAWALPATADGGSAGAAGFGVGAADGWTGGGFSAGCFATFATFAGFGTFVTGCCGTTRGALRGVCRTACPLETAGTDDRLLARVTDLPWDAAAARL